jgi:hypothetical protein
MINSKVKRQKVKGESQAANHIRLKMLSSTLLPFTLLLLPFKVFPRA